MRWFQIRKANIDAELRTTFERYGIGTMQSLLTDSHKNYFQHKGAAHTPAQDLDSLLPWLTEQYDRAERKETWLLTMEIAITIFVAAELLLSITTFVCGKSK